LEPLIGRRRLVARRAPASAILLAVPHTARRILQGAGIVISTVAAQSRHDLGGVFFRGADRQGRALLLVRFDGIIEFLAEENRGTDAFAAQAHGTVVAGSAQAQRLFS